MKISKALKTKKVQVLIASGVLLAGLGGGAYYLVSNQDKKMGNTEIPSPTTTTTTDSQVQQNVESKSAATDNTTPTTTPAVVTAKPVVASLTDVSFSILRDGDQAIVYLYGPAGTYGVEKQIGGSWTTLTAQFDYSGRGGYNLDTIMSTDATTYYKVFKLTNGTRTAESGDTAITWQAILDNGTLTVPLAR